MEENQNSNVFDENALRALLEALSESEFNEELRFDENAFQELLKEFPDPDFEKELRKLVWHASEHQLISNFLDCSENVFPI